MVILSSNLCVNEKFRLNNFQEKIMSEKEQVVFQVNQSLFDQLTAWQAKMEADDNQLVDESESGESTQTETHPDVYENNSKNHNS
jgi:hypothetical protein